MFRQIVRHPYDVAIPKCAPVCLSLQLSYRESLTARVDGPFVVKLDHPDCWGTMPLSGLWQSLQGFRPFDEANRKLPVLRSHFRSYDDTSYPSIGVRLFGQ